METVRFSTKAISILGFSFLFYLFILYDFVNCIFFQFKFNFTAQNDVQRNSLFTIPDFIKKVITCIDFDDQETQFYSILILSNISNQTTGRECKIFLFPFFLFHFLFIYDELINYIAIKKKK